MTTARNWPGSTGRQKVDEEKFVNDLITLTGGDKSLIGDDCAILENFSPSLLVTTDQLASAIHYDINYTLENLADKLIGINLSDIAAMGGNPTAALFYLASGRPAEEIQELNRLLAEKLDNLRVELAGGDLPASSKNQETLGRVLRGKKHPEGILKRSCGKKDDLVAVSGPLGAAAGIIENDLTGEDYLREELCRIPNRLELGNKLVEAEISCAIDISDGLLKDLRRLLVSSGCGAVLEYEKIPISPTAEKLADNYSQALQWALTGGEDYELLFTFPEDKKNKLNGYNFRVLGRLTDQKSQVKFEPELPDSIATARTGYDHLEQNTRPSQE